MIGTAARLGVYGGILAVSFAASYGIGHATAGRTGVAAAPAGHVHPGVGGLLPPSVPAPVASSGPAGSAPVQTATPVGAGGYRLELGAVGRGGDGGLQVPFAVRGLDGALLSRFATVDGRQLEVAVLRGDLSDFRVVDPDGDGSGAWTLRLAGLPAGTYRVLVRFAAPGSDLVVLGADLTVPDPEVADPAVTTAGADGGVSASPSPPPPSVPPPVLVRPW